MNKNQAALFEDELKALLPDASIHCTQDLVGRLPRRPFAMELRCAIQLKGKKKLGWIIPLPFKKGDALEVAEHAKQSALPID